MRGTPVNRQWIFVLQDGRIVMDWSGGQGVDLSTNEFISYQEKDFSHVVQNAELDVLLKMGRILGFTDREVFVAYLPEPPEKR